MPAVTPRVRAAPRPGRPWKSSLVYHPKVGTTKQELPRGGTVDIAQRQSPLCYPMHDHSEPAQTAQGGNYNCGLISGMYFIGDRNTPGAQMNFPMDEDFTMMLTWAAAPAPPDRRQENDP